MIINFSVQNFKSIKDKVELSFIATGNQVLEEYYVRKIGNQKILKLGLIYGANASGKTNILKALHFLREIVIRPFKDKNILFPFSPFLFDDKTSKQNTIFSIEFIQNKIRYYYSVELNNLAIINEALYYYNPKKAIVFKRKTDLDKRLADIYEFGSKIKLLKEHKSALETNTLWNNTVLGGFLKTNIEFNQLKETTEWFKNALKFMISPKIDMKDFVSDRIESGEINKNNVISILDKADINISNIKIDSLDINIQEKDWEQILSMKPNKQFIDYFNENLKRRKKIEFQHQVKEGKQYSLPYNEESAGTQRYYQLGGLLDLIIRNDYVLPIDELESSLHPDLLKFFILVFLVNSKNSQIIATTHTRELLMEKEMLRNDTIWFTEKKTDGSTELFSLADFDSSVVRNTTSIYNAYKSGKLGAKPNLVDYYLDFENE
jgi:AAA15 family ATPase/GTPase